MEAGKATNNNILVDTLETTVKEKGDTNTEKKIKRSTLKYIKSGGQTCLYYDTKEDSKVEMSA